VERALKARYHDAMSVLGPQRKELDLLIGILPDNNGSLYGTQTAVLASYCSILIIIVVHVRSLPTLLVSLPDAR